MFIYLKRFIEKPELIDELTQAEWLVVIEIYKYVEGSLKPLEDEINAEENAEDPKAKRMVLISFSSPKGISFLNYSQPLIDKMKQCFENSENDIKVLTMRLSEKLKSLLN